MRIYLLLCILFLLCSFVFKLSLKSNYIPPGTLFIKDSLFMDRMEVSNRNWKEFIGSNRDEMFKDSEDYKELIPDSSITIKLKNYGKIKFDIDYFPLVVNKFKCSKLMQIENKYIKHLIFYSYLIFCN